MGRRKAYPRRQLQRLLRAWARKKIRPIFFIAAMLIALTIILAWWFSLLAGDRAWPFSVLGALHATLVVAVGATLVIAFLVQEASAIHQLRGAWGEGSSNVRVRQSTVPRRDNFSAQSSHVALRTLPSRSSIRNRLEA